MAGVEIRPAELRAVAAQMSNLNQAITARMAQLMSQLAGLQGLWSGPAADSFHDARADWEAAAGQHAQRLGEISQALLSTQRGFVTNDETGASTVRSIPVPRAP